MFHEFMRIPYISWTNFQIRYVKQHNGCKCNPPFRVPQNDQIANKGSCDIVMLPTRIFTCKCRFSRGLYKPPAFDDTLMKAVYSVVFLHQGERLDLSSQFFHYFLRCSRTSRRSCMLVSNVQYLNLP